MNTSKNIIIKLNENEENNERTISIKKLQKVVKADGYSGRISTNVDDWNGAKYIKLTDGIKINITNLNSMRLMFTTQNFNGNHESVIPLTNELISELNNTLKYFESLSSKDIYEN